MKKVLFIDRDGTLVIEPPVDYQLDSLEKLSFYPGVFQWLGRIANELDYDLVMVTNQDGLGTPSFPEDSFWPAHKKIIEAFAQEGIHFSEICIDRSFPADNAPTRKPRTGLLQRYIHGNYDLGQSFVIGDRTSDVELASNLSAQAIYIGEPQPNTALSTRSWKEIYEFLKATPRQATVSRQTKETHIELTLNLDGHGTAHINTGIGFFDHMLHQIATHGGMDLELQVNGDLTVDEHHTIEDVALTLGIAINQALGTKKGLARYGFVLPMDDCLAQVALDFGGRPWLVWDATFTREKVGKMPTEMVSHFFKSFSDTAGCNLHIQASGSNTHHKVEAIYKAFGKALNMAVKRTFTNAIPSTKGSV